MKPREEPGVTSAASPEAAPTAGLEPATPRSASSAATLFSPEEVLAGRFRILRFLGRGGMGEVYEAEDIELHERVALKTIRADLATHERAMERFKREIHLARKVTHLNVCRIFDLERHSGPSGDITFLTMELLHGETLAERIERQGPLKPEEARPIVAQMAEALVAAHRAGVIHRDFKPANVILAPTPGGEGVRAVVTDFGVACVAGEGQSAPYSASGALLAGTAAYMAPELAEGREATPASDVYSLGVAMYEMVTGMRPHGGDTKLSFLFRRLWRTVPSPRIYVPDLDPVWEAAIVRCLARDPSERFAQATDVLEALSVREASVTPGTLAEEAVRARSKRKGALLATVGLLAAVGLALWMGRGGRARTPLKVKPLQITTSSGLDIYPTFSPDGRSIAYSSDRDGRFQIYLRPLAPGGRDVRLTTDGDNFQPAWSPDGEWIAYHAKSRGGIWLVPAKGGPPRQLTDFGSRPAWSPDGALIAFQSQPLVDLGANAFPALPPSILWLVPREGGTPWPITRPGRPPGGHGAPSWSADGKRIVFAAADRRLAEIWSVSAEGSDPVRLVGDQPYAFDPVHGPDGRSLYYSAFSGSFDYSIWRLRLSPVDGRPDGKAVELAVLGFQRLRHLTVSAEGKIAYSALTLNSNLWSMRVSPEAREAEGSPEPLTTETGKTARPAFSPDGGRLAFDWGRHGTSTDIWIMDVESGRLEPLTSNPTEDDLPSWFPQGDRIAFLSKRSGRFAVWSVGIAGRTETPLLDLDQDIDWPRLSPDGRLIAFNSKKGGGTVNTWVVPVQGGSPRQLTFDRELMGFPCWSPDGKFLALEMQRGEESHIAVIPGDGGIPVQLTFDKGQSWPYSWSPDGDRIAFAGQREGVWNVWSVSRSTRGQKRLTNHSKLNAYVRTPAWSPRGDRIVYEYAETTGNIWMIENVR